MKLGVVVLAAGQGTRMRSRLPKVLHPLAGRPLLAHVLDRSRAIGADRTCVVYGHGGELVQKAVTGYGCVWVEQADQRGTGHAMMQAMPQMMDMDRVLVLYGDVPLIAASTLRGMVEAAGSAELGLLTAIPPDPTGYGRIVRDDAGRVLRIVEQRDATQVELGIQEVNTGFLVADRARLENWLGRIRNDNAQGEYYLTDIVRFAADDGIDVSTTHPGSVEEVAGVNDRVQLAALERHYQRTLAEELMRAGITLADPARLDIRGHLAAEPDVSIDVNVVIEGEVRLATGVSIGPNCLLKDCAIGARTQVFANCVIEGACVGRDARIGPFARLRPDAMLADAVHVGNFVEIKKSAVGEGSNVNHLSYIGDARIGGGVNVGAGTITCNYDGANKHVTEIGDRAFIGSNTALVAPVEVGAGATVGAGSVITRDAPAEKLTVARGRQITVENWRRPKKKLD
jgi:bifunctional UDP-N-acetylglucosamine pyrophosphorylase/glucosamine-1-phosphate N-acetyltransferase